MPRSAELARPLTAEEAEEAAASLVTDANFLLSHDPLAELGAAADACLEVAANHLADAGAQRVAAGQVRRIR